MSWYCCRRSLGSLLLDGIWTRKIIGTEEVDGVALSKLLSLTKKPAKELMIEIEHCLLTGVNAS